MITNNGYNGYCRHVDGGFLSSCYKRSISLIGAVRVPSVSCESHCTNQLSCVGYAVRYYSLGYYCYLYTSGDSTCPADFDYKPGKTAKTMDELKAIGGPGQWPGTNAWACYGKHLGKRIVKLDKIEAP